jgi:hypothetical protein
MKLWLKHPLMLIVSRSAPLVQNCLYVSSDAVDEMRAGPSMGRSRATSTFKPVAYCVALRSRVVNNAAEPAMVEYASVG